MATRNVRKKMAVGAALAAGAMAAGSAAFACTVYRGNMTFTNASGSQTVTGANSGMNWCGGQPAFTLTAPANQPTTFSVSSAPASTCLNALGLNRLAAGTYNVGHANGFMGQGAKPHINCHNTSPTSKVIGLYTADVNGSGSGGPYAYTAGQGGKKGYSNICVYHQTFADANDINIKNV